MSSCVVSDYSTLSLMSPFAESLATALTGFSFKKPEDVLRLHEVKGIEKQGEVSGLCSKRDDALRATFDEGPAPRGEACDTEDNPGEDGDDEEPGKEAQRRAYFQRMEALLTAQDNWFFLDTEATGRRNGRIIEVGIVETDHEGRITGGTNFRCNPHDRSSRSAKRIHGILDRELEHCYEFAHYAQELRNYLKDRVVIIHDPTMDVAWLNAEYHRIDPTLPPIETLCTIVDSLEFATMLPSERTRNGMDGLIEWYGFERLGRYHGGYDDAQMLAKVFRELWEDMQEYLGSV